MGYIDLAYQPREEDLLCCFRVQPATGVTTEQAAEHLAAESSIGTWTEVATLSPELRDRLRAVVYELSPPHVLVAYPADLFEPGSVPQLLSSVAGNVFGMKAVERLRLVDLRLPRAILEAHAGPALGVEGVRQLLGIPDRPLIGTIIKPKLGLPPVEHARVLQEAMEGGCDIVKDDENLTHQTFSPFRERVERSLEARRMAEAATGQRKAYLPNVTAETSEMLRRAELVRELGGRYVMVDVVTAGFAALETLRRADMGLALHAHRAMYASFARDTTHGISMLVLAKLLRLVGVDQLHIGTVVGKMEGDRRTVVDCHEALLGNEVLPSPPRPDRLGQAWHRHRAVLSVASGGLSPLHVPALVEIFGGDVLIQAGGGVHGHPDGTRAGARALRQALDAALAGRTLAEQAQQAPELARALQRWGNP